MERLKDKVIIITGAAQGMGKVHAKCAIEEGAKVVITDINAEKGNEVAKDLGDNALFIKHNVADEDDWKRVVQETEDKWGVLMY